MRSAAQRLAQYGLARLASGHSSRAVKYRIWPRTRSASKLLSSRCSACCCCVARRRWASSRSAPSGWCPSTRWRPCRRSWTALPPAAMRRGWSGARVRRRERYAQLLGDDAPQRPPCRWCRWSPRLRRQPQPSWRPCSRRHQPHQHQHPHRRTVSDLHARVDRLERELARLQAQLTSCWRSCPRESARRAGDVRGAECRLPAGRLR